MQTLAFDTETYRFGNGNRAPKLVCLQWDDGKDRRILAADQATLWAENALALVAEDTYTLVGQNVAYDMAVLAAANERLMPHIFAAYNAANVQCTKLRERLLDLAKGKTGPHTRQPGYYAMDSIVKRRQLPIEVGAEFSVILKGHTGDGHDHTDSDQSEQACTNGP